MLGTTLFLIFIYDIIKGIRRNVRLLEVDTSLYKIVERPSSAVIELNIDLQTIFALAKQWFVDFNATKTKSLIISKMRKKTIIIHQSLWSIQIFKTAWNCFYPNATWINHISNISSKALERIGYFRRYKYLLDRVSLQKKMYTFLSVLSLNMETLYLITVRLKISVH